MYAAPNPFLKSARLCSQIVPITENALEWTNSTLQEHLPERRQYSDHFDWFFVLLIREHCTKKFSISRRIASMIVTIIK